MEKTILSLLFLFLMTLINGQNIVQLSLIQGTVEVIRQAKTIPSIQISEGFRLQNYDTVVTGPRSELQITLSLHGLEGFLQIFSSTVFYLELPEFDGEQTTGIELLQGSLGVNLNQLVGNSALQVCTEALIVATNQKAHFFMTGMLSGDFLVTTYRGRVECRNRKYALFSELGIAVEFIQTQDIFRSFPIALSVPTSVENAWQKERLKVMQTKPFVPLAFFARRYVEDFALMARAYSMFRRQEPKEIQWKEQEEIFISDLCDSMVQKKDVLTTLLLQVRLQLSSLERSYYRIRELRQQNFKNFLWPEEKISKEYMIQEFFQRFERDEATVVSWMEEIRAWLRSYAMCFKVNLSWDSWNRDYVKGSDLFH